MFPTVPSFTCVLRAGRLLSRNSNELGCFERRGSTASSVNGHGKANRSTKSSRKKHGSAVYSGVVGVWDSATPALRPECDLRCAWRERGRPVSTEILLTWVSETEKCPMKPPAWQLCRRCSEFHHSHGVRPSNPESCKCTAHS